MGQLADRTMKNAAYSFLGFIWNLLLAFVSAPIIINSLGTSEYGFYVLINSVLTVFSLFDLGVSYSFFKKLSEDPENPDYPGLSRIFSLTFWFYAAVGIVSFVLIFVLRDFFSIIFKVTDQPTLSYGWLFFIVGISFLLKMLSVPMQQIPQAVQRNDLNVKLALINITGLQILSIIAVKSGWGLMGLVKVQLLSSLFILCSSVYLQKKLLPKLKLALFFSWHEFLKIFRSGAMVFVTNIMSNLYVQFDKFVLSFFWGPTYVTYYSTSQMLTDKIQNTASSFSQVFFPVFSNVNFLNQPERLKMIFRRGLRLTAVITFGLVVMIGSFGWEFLHYWLDARRAGHNFAQQAIPAIYILAFTYFLLSLYAFLNAFFMGIKRLKFAMFATATIAVLDIVFMFLLIPKYAVTGASIAYLISVLPVIGFLYFIEKRIFNSPNTREIIWYYLKNFFKMFFVGALVFLVVNLFLSPLVYNLWTTLLFGGVGYLAYIGLYKLLGFFDPEDWGVVTDFAKKIFFKFKR